MHVSHILKLCENYMKYIDISIKIGIINYGAIKIALSTT